MPSKVLQSTPARYHDPLQMDSSSAWWVAGPLSQSPEATPSVSSSPVCSVAGILFLNMHLRVTYQVPLSKDCLIL